MGAAALALGIVGVVLCWIPFLGWVGILVALVALVLAVLAIRRGEKRLGIAGLVLAVIGLAWGGWEQLMALRAFDETVDAVSGNEAESEGRDLKPEQEVHPSL
jgi:uncharacterized membrane protein YccC